MAAYRMFPEPPPRRHKSPGSYRARRSHVPWEQWTSRTRSERVIPGGKTRPRLESTEARHGNARPVAEKGRPRRQSRAPIPRCNPFRTLRDSDHELTAIPDSRPELDTAGGAGLALSFDVQSLLAAARAETGLDDFGDPAFMDGLTVLATALSETSHLNETGKGAWHEMLRGYLLERLRVEDWFRRHPEIEDEEIRRPIVVTGLPRTGTTALTKLLAQDPAARSLRSWESARPTPPPETAHQHDDPRIALADATLAGMKAAAPDLAKMHDDTGASPTESQDLLGMFFRTLHFDGMADLPDYLSWWLNCDMEPAYHYHARVLRLLQWRCPPHRWNLKNPPDIFFLDALTRVHPDARIVWTHRDPARVLASVCSLVATVRSIFSDDVRRASLGEAQLANWSEGIRRALAFRRREGPGRFVDVQMSDLVERPLETVATVYDELGLEFSKAIEKRIRTWSDENPQGKHGSHHPTLEEFGLDPDRIHAVFADYLDSFSIPIEDPERTS